MYFKIIIFISIFLIVKKTIIKFLSKKLIKQLTTKKVL